MLMQKVDIANHICEKGELCGVYGVYGGGRHNPNLQGAGWGLHRCVQQEIQKCTP